MKRKHQVLPIILGFDPPNKEVIFFNSRGSQWSGFDVLIFDADYQSPKKIGEEIKGEINTEELKGLECWLHFRTAKAMESFGNMIAKYAQKWSKE